MHTKAREEMLDTVRSVLCEIEIASHAASRRAAPLRSTKPCSRTSAHTRRRAFTTHVAGMLSCLALSACASVSFERHTATSGTFKSSGWSITILQMDFPKGALSVARENASDANMANMVVENVTQIPSWPPLDWLFDIFSIRYASVSGTWGFTGQENQSADVKP